MKKFFLIAILMLSLASCQDSLIEQDYDKIENAQTKTFYWGNKIEDPYSVTNMRRAYNLMLKEKESSISKVLVEGLEIKPTHIYLKFMPKNYNEWEILNNDSILDVTPFPLTYDYEGFNGICRDPECPKDQPTYQYAVANINYQLPNIEYIVLDSLYMPFENATQKSEKMLSFWKELELMSIKLTGNEDDIEVQSISKRYYPNGRVTYQDEQRGIVAVPNAKVQVNYGTHKHSCYTDADGYFQTSEKFSFKVNYVVFFRNNNLSICNERQDDFITAIGEKATSCYDFNINTKKQKAAAISLVACNDFLNNNKGINTDLPQGMMIYYIDYKNFETDKITFVNNFKKAKINIPDFAHCRRYGDCINILAGIVIENKKNIIIYDTDILENQWCKGVEWYLTKSVYNFNGYDNESLIKDLIDTENSNYDKVGGYAITTIFNCVLKSKTLDDLKNELKKTVSSSTEKTNLDILFNYWTNKLK